MFIGHLPAGYLAARYLWCRCEALRGVEWKYLVAAALLGSVFPDLDWFYFYFVDHRRHHHHTYWTHLPIFWAVAIPIALLLLRATRTPRAFALAAIFGGSAFVHLLFCWRSRCWPLQHTSMCAAAIPCRGRVELPADGTRDERLVLPRIPPAVRYFLTSAATCIRTILSGFFTTPFSAGSPFLILSTYSMPLTTVPNTV